MTWVDVEIDDRLWDARASVRLINALKWMVRNGHLEAVSLEEIAQKERRDFMRIPNIGKASVSELESILTLYGMSFLSPKDATIKATLHLNTSDFGRLQQAAQNAGRTVNEEIQHRIEASLCDRPASLRRLAEVLASPMPGEIH